MARRKAKLDITLFPFLSVLSGLIAVNVLFMIVTISTRVISPESEAPVPKREEKKGNEGDVEDSKAIPDGIDATTYEELERQVKVLEKTLEDRRAVRHDVQQKLREIASAISAKELELERSQIAATPRLGTRIGEPPRKKLLPRDDGRGNLKNPVFIEVSSSRFVLHPEKKIFPYEPNATGKDPADIPADLKQALAEIQKDSKNRYPLFLIHPNGADAFRSVMRHVGRASPGLNVGWEPFSSDWLVDSSK